MICFPPKYLGDQMKKMRLAGHVICVGARRGSCRVLVGKSVVKNQLIDLDLNGSC